MTRPLNILLVNDDGPPNPRDSPFILPFHDALLRFISKADSSSPWRQSSLTVVVPAVQQSWTSKTHTRGNPLFLTKYNPPSDLSLEAKQWNLLSGSPAACTNVGLFHLVPGGFEAVDLVISGPNCGRNTGTAFALSSGTIGAALEGSLCGKRGIALSFGFNPRDIPFAEEAINVSAQVAVRLISDLWSSWPEDVDLFNVNIPLSNNSNPEVIITTIHRTQIPSCLYSIVNDEKVEVDSQCSSVAGSASDIPQNFKFAPKMAALVNPSSAPVAGSDAHALQEGKISVTPLRAGFELASGSSFTSLSTVFKRSANL